jgi:hypothetical protein
MTRPGPWAFFSLPTRAWELGLGAIVADPCDGSLDSGGHNVTLGCSLADNPEIEMLRLLADENFIFTVVQFEADALQDSVSHGLSGQLGLGGLPVSLNGFGVVG